MASEISVKVVLDTEQFHRDLDKLKAELSNVNPCCWFCRLRKAIRELTGF